MESKYSALKERMQHTGTSRHTDVASWWPPGELYFGNTGLFSLTFYNWVQRF